MLDGKLFGDFESVFAVKSVFDSFDCIRQGDINFDSFGVGLLHFGSGLKVFGGLSD